MPLIYNSMNTCTHERTHSDGVTQHVPWQPCSISLFPCCKMLQNIPISGPGNTHSRQLLQSYRAVLLVTWPVCPQWLGGVGVKSGLASPAPGVSHLWGRAPVPGGGAGQARCTGRLLGVRGPCCQCSLLVWPSVVSSVPCRLQGGSPAATSLAAQFLPSEMGLRSPPPPHHAAGSSSRHASQHQRGRRHSGQCQRGQDPAQRWQRAGGGGSQQHGTQQAQQQGAAQHQLQQTAASTGSSVSTRKPAPQQQGQQGAAEGSQHCSIRGSQPAQQLPADPRWAHRPVPRGPGRFGDYVPC
jgi:hypothetical protein